MKGIASIESDMNPSAGARGSHKGLFQISGDEWNRFAKPGENILSAKDNAAVAGRLFEANRAAFRKAMGRDPTDKELYMMHQQGMGHFTRGALTNVHGNRYPGMHGAQTPESFREGWGRELARRKAQFENPGAATAPQASTSPTSAPPAVAPGAVNAPNGQAPQKLIIHHTGGRGGPQGVRDTLAQRGLGVQYIVDRDGNVVEGGGNKRSHIKDGWGPGAGLSNSNTVGFEVIAKDDKDVTAAQIEGVKRFVEKYYPNTPVMGHGQANPGHKEADEGKTIVDAINAERAKRSTAAQ
ncbi:peptidoglycan recognition protein family protein [Bradyrhizobium sp. LeoA1S1]